MSDWPFVEYRTLSSSERSAFSMGPFGSKITKENYVATGVPVVRGVNLARGIFVDDDFVFIDQEKADELVAANVAPGDLIFTHRGTIGQVSMLPRKPRFDRYVIGSSQVKTRLDESIAVPEFYYYWFMSPGGQRSILANTSTVGVPGIATPLTSIKGLRVPLPPLTTQQAVAAVLGALDDKIAVNGRIATTSDQYCAALFEKIIVENSNGITKLREVATLNAKTVKSISGASLRYVDIASVGDGRLTWPERTSWDEAPSRARRGISIGDTLWSTVRPNRRSRALVLDEDPLLVASTGFAVITPRSGGPAFVYESARRDEFVAYLESVAEGSAYPAVRAEKFLDAPIPDAADEYRDRFEALAWSARLRVHSATQESRALAEIRDTLLPELMSGRLRVKDAEKILEEAV